MLTRSVTSPIARLVARSVSGAERRSTALALPNPSTVNFTAAQVSPGFTGSVSTTKNAARIYGRASLTLWCGFITGTEAKLQADSEYGANAGLIQVAIDGGDFADAPNASTTYTLFTGLPHATRFVEVRYASAYADAPFVPSSGNILAVTGQPPSIAPLANWIQAGTDAATGLFSGGVIANTATYSPAIQAQKGIVYGSNVGSAKLKGAFSKLVVTVNGLRKIAVSKNGAAPTFYAVADESNNPIRAIVVPCDGSTSTYYVWDDGNFRTDGGHFSVAGDSTLLDIGTRRRMDQFGDSITYGAGPGATSVDTETMRVAASMGFVGSTNGISGHTIAACKTLLDTVLPTKTVTSSDVAILAIGGNNAPGIDATEQTDYGLCIDKLLAKGYGKVICRGILPRPDGSNSWTTDNAALQSVVTAKANPNVLWVNPSTWIGYDTTDQTHPTAAGYVTLAGFAAPAYTALNL